jgi:hypothetical protein
LLGTINVPSTGGLSTWATTTAAALTAVPPIGHQNLALVFKCAASNTFQLNWIQFSQVPTTSLKFGDASIGQSGFQIVRCSNAMLVINCATEAFHPEIHIYSTAGREIIHAIRELSQSGNRTTATLDARYFLPGSYIVSIKNHGRSFQKSFVVE